MLGIRNIITAIVGTAAIYAAWPVVSPYLPSQGAPLAAVGKSVLDVLGAAGDVIVKLAPAITAKLNAVAARV